MPPRSESVAVMYGREQDAESLQSEAEEQGATSVVAVLARTPPGTWLDDWEAGDGPTPYVVDLTGESGSSLRLPTGEGRVIAGVDRTDLTGVSMAVSEFAEQAHGPVVVYFQSLSTLLLCAGVHRTAAFLQTVKRTIGSTGGRVVADLDPEAVDGRTIQLLGTLFDSLVTEGPTGTSPAP